MSEEFTSASLPEDSKAVPAALKRVARAFFALSLAGAIIGLFHQYDLVVSIILAIVTPFFVINTLKRHPHTSVKILIPIGTVVTGSLGLLAEHWGIHNGHWIYHDLSDNREYAYWLFFAWALAFVFLYRVEASLIEHWKINTFRKKLLLVIVVSTILPTWGEIVAINLGTWTYSWEYQFFGVPALAILLLTLFHTGIFLLFYSICRIFKIDNPVFNVS
ncbi:MAG: hypothetical protein OEZ16_04915 [Chromatiales bacterium]|nr:hypothetical protein [Chromatiales bacterium]